MLYIHSGLYSDGFCVKEIMKMPSGADCGRTDYFGDKYNSKTTQCEFRKCAANCTEGHWSYEFQGQAVERKRFCCNYKFCNGTSTVQPGATMYMLIVVFAVISLVCAIRAR